MPTLRVCSQIAGRRCLRRPLDVANALVRVELQLDESDSAGRPKVSANGWRQSEQSRRPEQGASTLSPASWSYGPSASR